MATKSFKDYWGIQELIFTEPNGAFEVYGRINDDLKIGSLRINGHGVTPGSAVYEIDPIDIKYEPLNEFASSIRYGGIMVVQPYVSDNQRKCRLVIRDINTSQGWLSGSLMYPIV